ncbi:MoaD/ThiS family protein [Amnibacterium flavum]|uniref:Molybdopterin synthase sulfur carrier subunit n=1 Tax=Amnibacterium flavum TaxID=2173173 RepID=A0A2V1HTX4_9MICO|nr:MoaD/ThiS family protein [Amnibacterium flavum]PVZ96056.1 molybdopterin synthase sulfur carrier subunit [Amnibacterium flavum]
MAQLRIRYFAAAAEIAGVEEEVVTTSAATTGELKAELLSRFGGGMTRVLAGGSLLVDGVVRRDDSTPLGAAVDVLPAFSGG